MSSGNEMLVETVVDVVLVKVTTKKEVGCPPDVKREVIVRIPSFAFTGKSNEDIREEVLFKHHEEVSDAGGPENVEVLISRPFFQG